VSRPFFAATSNDCVLAEKRGHASHHNMLEYESCPQHRDRGATVVYVLPDSGRKKRADYTARFDNFGVSAHGAAPGMDKWNGNRVAHAWVLDLW